MKGNDYFIQCKQRIIGLMTKSFSTHAIMLGLGERKQVTLVVFDFFEHIK
jgi:hypothetical protein